MVPGPARRVCSLALPAVLGCQDVGLRARDEEAQALVRVEETFTQSAGSPVDLLVVVANSGSMAAESRTLLAAAPALAAALSSSGLSFQVGVIPADLGDPDLGLLRGDHWILTPSTPNLPDALAAALDQGTSAAGPEGGLAAAIAALSEPRRSADNAGFRRPGAALRVLIYSDDDDASDAFLGEDAVAAVATLLADEADEAGATLSAIVGTEAAGCSTDQARATFAPRYLAAVEATGGQRWSICEGGLAARWSTLLPVAEDLPTTFPLAARPAAGHRALQVDGAPVTAGWTLTTEPPALIFDEAPPAGAAITLRYAVAP